MVTFAPHPPLTAQFALRALDHLQIGCLELTLPDGGRRVLHGSRPGPRAVLEVRDWAFFRRVILSGDIGLAEAYMDGLCDTPDLVTLIELLALNEPQLAKIANGSWWRQLGFRLAHAVRHNSRQGARRNIRAHYDLGNDFYSLWLDPTMTYSSALFDGDPSRPLEVAQRAKYARIVNRLGLRQGDSVLEIGCGWGGFAEAAARLGARVTAITISAAQAEFARQRLARADLAHAAKVDLCDYRDVRGAFDHIVSIEMIEAVGERHWPAYFAALKRHLNPGGKAIVQAITIADAFYQQYRRRADFIQTHIFPGGMLPSPTVIADQARRVGLSVADSFGFGGDYASTLRTWLARFDDAVDRVKAQGFDDRFVRMWRYYLSYCAVGFATARTDVVQAEFTHA
ncbi:MAG TPA: cyclopropane-fatty-acyl-phospholipid synthase family protein [Vineibacter sp.]|nr:cyclopropane-fatty-acyl-phospholipid synthase family protein [Vineibacter sp.]